LMFSPDGGRLAYVAVKGGESRVVLDDKEVFLVPAGKWIAPSGTNNEPGPAIVFSPDGTRYALSLGDQVVIDGEAGPQFKRVWSLGFSPDGKHVAYVAEEDGFKVRAVLDGKPRREFMEIQHLQFIPPGRLAYVGIEWSSASAQPGEQPPRVHHVMLDDQDSGSYDSIGSFIQASQDGAHYAFTATKQGDEKKGPDGQMVDPHYVVHDGKEIEYVPEPGSFGNSPTIVISPDGTRVAYIEQGRTARFVTVSGKSGDTYDQILNLKFSPKGRHYTYDALQTGSTGGHHGGDQSFLVVDGEEVADVVAGTIVFSPDESRYAAVARAGNGTVCALIDGKKQKPYRVIDSLQFSPDGKRIAYFAANINAGEQYVVIDGEERPYVAVVKESLAFSPDSAHFGFAAKLRGRDGTVRPCLVVDGRQSPLDQHSQVRAAPIRFSPDSDHVVHLQSKMVGRNTAYEVVINGKAVEGYFCLSPGGREPPPLAFTPEGSVYYQCAKDGTLYAVTATPAPGDSHASLPAAAPNTAAPNAAEMQAAGRTHGQRDTQQQQQQQQQQTQQTQQQQQQQRRQEEPKKTKEQQRAEEAARRAEDAAKAAKGIGDLFRNRRR